jgi:hypothetical protein
VHAREGKLGCHVIGSRPARGLCGSELGDEAAGALELGLIGANGRLRNAGKRCRCEGIALAQSTLASCNWPRARWRLAFACWHREASRSSISGVPLGATFGRRARAVSDFARRRGRETSRQYCASPHTHAFAYAFHAPGAATKDFVLSRHIEVPANRDFEFRYPEMMAVVPTV